MPRAARGRLSSSAPSARASRACRIGAWQSSSTRSGSSSLWAAILQVSRGFVRDFPYFRIAKFEVSGVSDRVKQDVRAALDTALGPNPTLLGLDKEAVRSKLARIPYVRDLTVETVLPDTIIVKAAERQPEAVVHAGEQFFLIDREGRGDGAGG